MASCTTLYVTERLLLEGCTHRSTMGQRRRGMLHLPSSFTQEEGCEAVVVRPSPAESACWVQLSEDGGRAMAECSGALLFARNCPKSRTFKYKPVTGKDGPISSTSRRIHKWEQ